MKLVPLEDHVILEGLSEAETTKGGVYLPDTADKGKPEQGTIISVGPGKLMENGQRQAMSVKVGDIVLFKKYSPDEVKIGKEEFLIISESDVMALVE